MIPVALRDDDHPEPSLNMGTPTRRTPAENPVRQVSCRTLQSLDILQECSSSNVAVDQGQVVPHKTALFVPATVPPGVPYPLVFVLLFTRRHYHSAIVHNDSNEI